MSARFPGLIFGAALAAYLGAGAAAFAEPAQGPAARTTPVHPQDVMIRRAPSQAEQASRLRDLLQLRPAQEPALQAYVAALDTAQRAMSSPPPGPLPATTPERLDRMQQMMAARQSAGASAMAATRRFYDQLDAGQKRAFDAMPLRLPLGHGHKMGPGPMMGHGDGGPDPRDHLKPAPGPVR